MEDVGKQPTIRARWLGKELQELRKAAGVEVQAVAEFLGKQRAVVSRFERGEFPISIDELPGLLDLYRLNDLKKRASLFKLAQEVTQRGWADGHGVDSGLANLIWLEENAQRILIVSTAVVHGLFQTPDYARTLFDVWAHDEDPDQARRWLDTRQVRGELIQGPAGPLVKVLLLETVLDHQVGGGVVMADQINHLISTAELPQIELRVLPRKVWKHIGMSVETGFTLFEMRNDWPTVVATDSPAGTVYAESPDIDWVSEGFQSLWHDEALDESQSADLLKAKLKDVTIDDQP
ncbi:helix-turn-helix domain-containing protein [Glycomyces xiaoerkulensis]|uniref:helix-turn-helix domain-containing protein n=1 Tax=Glycomyces xiaoerkulensis TaxID=2038139 RepID=UPI0012FFEE29|nr:helix-turn-helix transcriptional regulator [Glycomyces xiaoerkulensis]